MSGFIVDNSVWQRLQHEPTVLEAYSAFTEATRPGLMMVCDIQVAEIGCSARNEFDHARIGRVLGTFRDCPTRPSTADVLVLQRKLWSNGLVRAVGAADTVIAAYALANDAVVVHYDSDFEHIAKVEPRFRHRWIVPRGSL